MNTSCPFCFNLRLSRPENRTVIRKGYYFRKSDGCTVRRFWCTQCKNGFSNATDNWNYNQKKRQINFPLAELLCGNMSQREAARVLKINRKTVARKLQKLGKIAKTNLEDWGKSQGPAKRVQFDDLETFEHTKCKPLSVTLIVEEKTRRIIDFEVSQMVAKGLLAKKSVKKYGKRRDDRGMAREKLFKRLTALIEPDAHFLSDSNPYYPANVKKYFPNAIHSTVIGARGSSTGQGELKKIGHDPLFSLNHTCAMLRANISRLIRKTWCTTKKMERLRAHIYLYAMSHNRRLAQGKGPA